MAVGKTRHLRTAHAGHDDFTNIDGSNPEHVTALLDDLKVEFNKQLEALKADVMSAKNMQQQAFASGMVKLPKKDKSLSIAEFDKTYGCDLITIMKNIRDEQVLAQRPASKKRERLENEIKTPAPVRRSHRCGMRTASRTIRRGEKVFSENGSPVDQVDEGVLTATIKKKKRAGRAESASACIDINVGDGQFISLDDPNAVQSLDQQTKNNALSQLQVLQDQMDSLMKQLQN